MSTRVIPPQVLSLTARDLWLPGSGWDFDRISPYITNHQRLSLASVVIDTASGERDKLAWGETENGIFTVSSAYAMLVRNESPVQSMECFYNRIWKARVPERVRVFLWLVGQQVLMTNQERKRRHLSDVEVCSVCQGGVETILHILRDCPAMRGIWLKLIPRRRLQTFFEMSLLEWVFTNLGEGEYDEVIPWASMFAMACWWSWKWRCMNVFGEKGTWKDRVRFLRNLAREVAVAERQKDEKRGDIVRIERMIAWERPLQGWYKINTDGASHGNPGLATAGGVIRNDAGEWICGFALNIGVCSAPLAELWGVYYGLVLAWEEEVRQIELEVDSELVVGFLTTGIGDFHPLSFLVRLCHGYLSKDWTVRIRHVYRKANRLADGLANYAFKLPLGFHHLFSVPLDVESVFSEDFIGVAHLRYVRL